MSTTKENLILEEGFFNIVKDKRGMKFDHQVNFGVETRISYEMSKEELFFFEFYSMLRIDFSIKNVSRIIFAMVEQKLVPNVLLMTYEKLNALVATGNYNSISSFKEIFEYVKASKEGAAFVKSVADYMRVYYGVSLMDYKIADGSYNAGDIVLITGNGTTPLKAVVLSAEPNSVAVFGTSVKAPGYTSILSSFTVHLLGAGEITKTDRELYDTIYKFHQLNTEEVYAEFKDKQAKAAARAAEREAAAAKKAEKLAETKVEADNIIKMLPAANPTEADLTTVVEALRDLKLPKELRDEYKPTLEKAKATIVAANPDSKVSIALLVIKAKDKAEKATPVAEEVAPEATETVEAVEAVAEKPVKAAKAKK